LSAPLVRLSESRRTRKRKRIFSRLSIVFAVDCGFFFFEDRRLEDCLEVSALSLIQLDRLEQRLEVSGAEALMVAALNGFEEERRPVLARLREDLQEISIFVEVDEDVELLQRVHVFLDNRLGVTQSFAEVLVVSLRNGQEHAPASFQVLDRADDVVGVESDVLNTGAAVVIDVLLDLALALSRRRFVNRHLHCLVPISHHD